MSMNELLARIAGLAVMLMMVVSLYGSAFGIGGAWHSNFWMFMKAGAFLVVFGVLWVIVQVGRNE